MVAHKGGHAHHGEAEAHATHHIVSIGTYLRVFAVLIVGLLLTLEAARHDWGAWNLVIAMAIAAIKVIVIALYFMHLKYSSPLVKFFGGAALFWLIIMFGLTFTDYMTRSMFGLPGSSVHGG